MGADDSGDDLVVGEGNEAQSGTGLFGNVDSDGKYPDGVVLAVRASGLIQNACDGIQSFATTGGTGLYAESDWGDGVFGYTKGNSNSGAVGKNDGNGFGLFGHSVGGDGVFGLSNGDEKSGAVGRNDAAGYGVFGHSERGTGVYGESLAVEGDRRIGVRGIAQNGGIGVHGETQDGTGVRGTSVTGNYGFGDAGVVGVASAETNGAGIFGISESADGGRGVYGMSPAGDGVFGYSTGDDMSGTVGRNDAAGYGVFGHSERGTGVYGETHAVDGLRRFGVHGVAANGGVGVQGDSVDGTGVSGQSAYGPGVQGSSGADVGVEGTCLNGAGVRGLGSDWGVAGTSPKGYGGSFAGGRAAIRLEPAMTQGAPKTGTHQAGELFVDSGGALYYCRTGGTPGTWVHLA
jgi:hypothetical protein